MKSVIILALIFVSAFSTTLRLEEQLIRDLFTQWQGHHDKVYTTSFEEEARFEIFAENYLQILEFNNIQDDVTLALNSFADLTEAEFKSLYTGMIPKTNNNVGVANFDVTDVPTTVDWRTKGAVTPVKNQGMCGSCWAFSATGALEGLNFINSSKLLSFSEQQLVDCVTADFGCNGGLPTDAFAYTAQIGGIETESDYPYTAKDGTCNFDKTKAHKVNTAYLNVTQGTETVKAAVAGQPVSVGIQANQLIFQFYKRGVIKRFCGANIDHGVLIVGYDSSQGSDAFIVKNSWGGTWGDSGYVHISTDGSANNGKGVCGILSMASIPTNE